MGPLLAAFGAVDRCDVDLAFFFGGVFGVAVDEDAVDLFFGTANWSMPVAPIGVDPHFGLHVFQLVWRVVRGATLARSTP